MSAPETARSRVCKVLRGEMPGDRLPLIEWAAWWDKTIDRWHGEGLTRDLDYHDLQRAFGLDLHLQHWFWGWDGKVKPIRAEPTVWIESDDQYDAVRSHAYNVWTNPAYWARAAAEQASGDAAFWVTFNGFFWWPRVLFGIEPHLYAFYDQPELMHRINADQADYCLRCLDAVCKVATPDFMTFAEDMSYNHGPMLSKELFDEFLAPYYRKVVPALQDRGITVLIDSDGDVTAMVPWLKSAGIEGILPLERKAGVDLPKLHADHPDFLLVGGFDKLCMNQGEDAIVSEFERLLPAMRQGRFIPSVDHQTPPEVSLEQYRDYLKWFKHYARLAVATNAAGAPR